MAFSLCCTPGAPVDSNDTLCIQIPRGGGYVCVWKPVYCAPHWFTPDHRELASNWFSICMVCNCNVWRYVCAILSQQLPSTCPTNTDFCGTTGFPFTVFSQLTTGPMLDVIAPEDKIGFVQGLNNSTMNFGMALAPVSLILLFSVDSILSATTSTYICCLLHSGRLAS